MKFKRAKYDSPVLTSGNLWGGQVFSVLCLNAYSSVDCVCLPGHWGNTGREYTHGLESQPDMKCFTAVTSFRLRVWNCHHYHENESELYIRPTGHYPEQVAVLGNNHSAGRILTMILSAPRFQTAQHCYDGEQKSFPFAPDRQERAMCSEFRSSKIRLFFGSLSNVCFLKFMVFYFPHSAVQGEFNNQWTWYSMNNQFLFILWIQLGQGSIMPRVSGSQFLTDTLTSKYESNVQIKAKHISSSFYFSSWVSYFLPLLSIF